MIDWPKLSKELEGLLRLRTSPLAYKRLDKVEDLKKIPGVRIMPHKPTICQLLNLARSIGWTMGVTADTVFSCHAPQRAGLVPIPENPGARRVGTWHKTIEDANKFIAAIPTMPGKCEALVIAPLASEAVEPDVVLVYGVPGQIILLINGLQREDYAPIQSFCVGESSCIDAIQRCYVTGQPSLALPCYGERWFGGTRDDEIVMGLPPGILQKAIDGLRELHAIGYRYPIPTLGSEADPWEVGLYKMYGPGAIESIESGKSFWEH